MKDLTLPRISALESEPYRSFVTRVLVYAFAIFCLLPLVTGIGLPFWLSLTDEPLAELPMRLTLLVSTGGASFLLVAVPVFFLQRARKFRALYVFLLLPLAAICQAAQFIMYREFGTEISERAKGLFAGNISALWAFGCSEYHLHWFVAGVLLLSLGCTAWICRTGPCRWHPSPKALGVLSLIFLTTGAMALGFRPQLARIAHYHPTKVSSAPLFQLLGFVNKYYLQGQGSSYSDLLEKTGPMIEGSERGEITRRLGEDPDGFAARTVEQPAWLKQRPTQVFLFLLESYGYGVLEDPAFAEITPRLRRFAEQGISVSHFCSANNQTITSVHAMASGVAPMPFYPAPRSLSYFPLDTLPRLMARAGYQPLFFAASHRHFGSKGDYCEGYGYERFVGCPDVAHDLRSNEWGVSDGDFFEWCREELGGHARPRFVSFLNVSNHSPYDAPDEKLKRGGSLSAEAVARFYGGSEEEKLSYALHARYADAEIGIMVDHLEKTCPGALFVFVGDHGAAKMRSDPNLRVPFVLYGPEVLDATVDTSAWFGSHMDILATLAPLVMKEGDGFTTLGSPVWDRSAARVSCSGDQILTTAGYHDRRGNLLRPLEDEERAVWEGPRSALKASAVEALSWGHLNLRRLPAD